MSQRFDDKVALVTGGASGLGAASARLLAERGASVVLSDINDDLGESVAASIREAGGKAEYVRCDVARADQVKALIDGIVARHGRLDCAVNNAGIEHGNEPMINLSEEVWDRTQEINLKGVWLCLKHEIPVMLAQGGGAIVNMASVAGLIGAPLLGPYCASKHGVVGLTKSAAVEYGKSGIRINAVCPSFIRTPMVERSLEAYPQLAERIVKANPFKRLGEPEEVAEAVLWLCSDAASFVHGHALAVDGGLVAQ